MLDAHSTSNWDSSCLLHAPCRPSIGPLTHSLFHPSFSPCFFSWALANSGQFCGRLFFHDRDEIISYSQIMCKGMDWAGQASVVSFFYLSLSSLSPSVVWFLQNPFSLIGLVGSVRSYEVFLRQVSQHSIDRWMDWLTINYYSFSLKLHVSLT